LPDIVLINEGEIVIVEVGYKGQVILPGEQGPPGPQGIQGVPGTAVMPVNADLVGAKNGVNTIFTFPTPPAEGREFVFFNGVKQRRGTDYSIAGDVVTCLTFVPEAIDFLDSIYFEE